MEAKIYALVDPRTSFVQYVGKTCTPLRDRLAMHLCQGSKAVLAWATELKALGLKPDVFLIDEVPMDEWRWRENDLIEAFPSLLNVYSGGGGGGFQWSPTRHEYNVKRGRNKRDRERLVSLDSWEESQDIMAESVISGQQHASSMGWGSYSDVE